MASPSLTGRDGVGLFLLLPQYDIDDVDNIRDVNGLAAVDVAKDVDEGWGVGDSENVVHDGDNVRNVDSAIKIHIALLAVDGDEIYFVELIFYRFLLLGTEANPVVVEAESHFALQRKGGGLGVAHGVEVDFRWVFGDSHRFHVRHGEDAKQQDEESDRE